MRILLAMLILLFSCHTLACDTPLRVAKSGSGKVTTVEQGGRDILKKASCTIQPVEFDEFVTLDRRIALLVAGEIDLIIAVVVDATTRSMPQVMMGISIINNLLHHHFVDSKTSCFASR